MVCRFVLGGMFGLFYILLTLKYNLNVLASQSRSRSNSISRSRRNSLVTSSQLSPESSKENQKLPPDVQNEPSEDTSTVPQKKDVHKSPIPYINVDEPPEV